MSMLDKNAANAMLKRVGDIMQQEFGKENVTKLRGSFSEGRMKVTIELKPEMTDAEKDALRKKEWDLRCKLYNLVSEDFGMQVTLRGVNFIVHGLKPAKRGADPVQIKRIDNGVIYVTKAENIINARPKDQVVQPSLTIIDMNKHEVKARVQAKRPAP